MLWLNNIKTFVQLHTVILGLPCVLFCFQATGGGDAKKAETIYDFTVSDIDGNEVCLDKYK